MTFYGESKCVAIYASGKFKGKRCNNGAYWKAGDKLLCGVHSKGIEKEKLPKNPNAKQLLIEKKQRLLKMAKEWKGGSKITLTKLRMMKEPERDEGAYGIYPNFKHGGKTIDEIGFPTLSPKWAWTPVHGMKGVPQAHNIENLHQGSKMFKTEGFEERRDEMFLDQTPWRHKFQKFPQLKALKGNKNIPICSVYSDSKGNVKQFNYLQCRYFYCYFYEKMSTENEDFEKLKKMYDNGAWIQIIGYDAYPINLKYPKVSLWDAYLDTSKPFGHELVLVALLTIENPKNYPWNRYWRKNKKVYFDDWEVPHYLKS